MSCVRPMSKLKLILTLSCCKLQVIRENQVIVVVGETGSGKTTQMTQVKPLFLLLLLIVFHSWIEVCRCGIILHVFLNKAVGINFVGKNHVASMAIVLACVL